VLRRHIGARVVLSRGDIEVASWPLTTGDRLDLRLVDDLARLHLAAERLGCSLRLRDVCVELSELLDLVGLRAVLTCSGGSVLEVVGKPEGHEQIGVEEVVVPDDPVA
jgi:hypothetical protein